MDTFICILGSCNSPYNTTYNPAGYSTERSTRFHGKGVRKKIKLSTNIIRPAAILPYNNPSGPNKNANKKAVPTLFCLLTIITVEVEDAP